tara:strand:- start:964 stop:1653 length:690 start_codon:yes stop_codon:yes gene_type:complete
MDRKAEPEFMNTKDQVDSYSDADFSKGEIKFIQLIKNYLNKNNIQLTHNDLIVDLGCGPGNISEKLSINWPDTSVLGIDGSKEMIYKAKSRRSLQEESLNNLNYLCEDIKNLKLADISDKKDINLLVSNSLIHHITHINEFFECIISLSSKQTLNFHKDLIRPINEKDALELKAECASKYNETLTSDYYASLQASYRPDELRNQILKNNLVNLDVLEEDNEYLILYGSV